MAIQDAVDNIRNTTEISNTASGVALSKILEGGDLATCLLVIEESKKIIDESIINYKKIIDISMSGRKKNYNISLNRRA